MRTSAARASFSGNSQATSPIRTPAELQSGCYWRLSPNIFVCLSKFYCKTGVRSDNELQSVQPHRGPFAQDGRRNQSHPATSAGDRADFCIKRETAHVTD